MLRMGRQNLWVKRASYRGDSQDCGRAPSAHIQEAQGEMASSRGEVKSSEAYHQMPETV